MANWCDHLCSLVPFLLSRSGLFRAFSLHYSIGIFGLCVLCIPFLCQRCGSDLVFPVSIAFPVPLLDWQSCQSLVFFHNLRFVLTFRILATPPMEGLRPSSCGCSSCIVFSFLSITLSVAIGIECFPFISACSSKQCCVREAYVSSVFLKHLMYLLV